MFTHQPAPGMGQRDQCTPLLGGIVTERATLHIYPGVRRPSKGRGSWKWCIAYWQSGWGTWGIRLEKGGESKVWAFKLDQFCHSTWVLPRVHPPHRGSVSSFVKWGCESLSPRVTVKIKYRKPGVYNSSSFFSYYKDTGLLYPRHNQASPIVVSEAVPTPLFLLR